MIVTSAGMTADLKALEAVANAHRLYVEVLRRNPWSYRAVSVAGHDYLLDEAQAHQQDLEMACREAKFLLEGGE